MTEIYRDVVGYAGLYEVSNLGNVRRYGATVPLKPRSMSGYNRVTLCRGALDRLDVCVARLVAEAFIPNPYGYTRVRHKDRGKRRDRVDNLEWCNAQRSAELALGKEVVVLDKHGAQLSTHPSATKAALQYGYTPQLVSNRCRTGRPTRDGLTFIYSNLVRR